MFEPTILIEDDKVYVIVPQPQYGENVCQSSLVMTKEVFKQCYEKWILNDTDGENGNA